jgi:hypothetical protein
MPSYLKGIIIIVGPELKHIGYNEEMRYTYKMLVRNQKGN